MRVLFRSMLMLSVLLSAPLAWAGKPNTLWVRHIGTPSIDYGYSIKQTLDGGFILTGVTHSSGSGDVYLLKTNADGDSIWSRTYGGPEEDVGKYVNVCDDGGYVVVGYTYSYGSGQSDLYLIRTDAVGDTLWTRVYGGTGYDEGTSVTETDEGGFIATGYANSWWIRNEAWVVKTDSNGDSVWTRRFQTVNNTYAHEVVETTLGGQTYSVGGTCRWLYRSNDFYLIRMEQDGDTLWTRSYGSTGWEDCYGLDRTDDLGFFLAGRTNSMGAAAWDFYIVRADAGGDSLWHRVCDTSGYDYAYSIKETPDGGCIAVGDTDYGPSTSNAYIVKLDAAGDTLWTRIYGSGSSDKAHEVQVTPDGGYIIGGWGYDSSGGGYDFMLIRMGPEASVEPPGGTQGVGFVRASPNPFASTVTISYALNGRAHVEARVYDITGRSVRTLTDGISQGPGLHSMVWDGRNSHDLRVPAGLYLCVVRADDATYVEKVMLLR
jgi:hypothetical protein